MEPVPPCPTERAVVRPVSEVISEFAPEAAAPRLVRAPDAVVAFVPPLPTGRVPVTPVVRETLVIVLLDPLIVLFVNV